MLSILGTLRYATYASGHFILSQWQSFGFDFCKVEEGNKIKNLSDLLRKSEMPPLSRAKTRVQCYKTFLLDLTAGKIIGKIRGI